MAESLLKSVFTKILILLVSVLVIIYFVVYPILILFPFVLYRCLINMLKHYFRPDLIKFLHPRSTIWTWNRTESSSANTIFTIKFEGKLDYDVVMERISNIFLKESNPKTGELLYPEFQMHLERWFGYYFWKLDEDFSFDKHTSKLTIPPEGSNQEEKYMRDLEKNVVKECFPTDSSPWKLICVEKSPSNEDSEPPSWYLIFCFHHTLADGMAMFEIFMKCTDNYQKTEPQAGKSNGQGICLKLFKLLTTPFQVAELATRNWSIWRIPADQIVSDRLILKSNPIPVSAIKNISRDNNVSFSAALLSVLSGSVYGEMIRSKRVNPIPKSLSSPMPVPGPKRPDGLLNSFVAIIPNYPIGVEDRKTRLRLCQDTIEENKKSTIPYVLNYMSMGNGLIPPALTKVKLSTNGFQTTIFAGPNHEVRMNGQPVSDIHFNLWWNRINTLLLCIVSYNGSIRIVANADKWLFPTEDALQEFVQEMEEEVHKLEDLSNSTQVV